MAYLKRWQLLVLVALAGLFAMVSGQTSTSLEIHYTNIPPQLMDTIPNQTWATSTNLTNSIDLDQYFLDNEDINYTASLVDSIIVFINETTHEVSFYPAIGFQGIRTVVFTATDDISSSNSNVVTLNVSPDTHSPTWSGVSISTSDIKQNSIVTFSSNWQDDTALGYFMLAINQDGTWMNQSPSAFSGKINTSVYSLQISAGAGRDVFWYLIGFDTSGNMNSTTMRNFTVQASTPPHVEEPDEEKSSSSGRPRSSTSKPEPTESIRDFVLDPLEGFKIDLLEGQDKTISFKITNTGTVTDRFNISVVDLDKFDYSISSNNFTVTPGASAVVTVNFKGKPGSLPDLYYGTIRVRTGDNIKKIPVVIELNALVTKLGLNLTIVDKKEYLPLDEITANITLTNLQDIKPTEVYAYYALVDFSGTVIDSTSDQFIFESRDVKIQKTLKLPENIGLGTYIFLSRVVTNGSVTIESESFEVGEKVNFASLILGNIWIIVLVGSIFITFIIGATEYRNRKRLNLLNMYILTNELSRLVKENNLNEAEKVYLKIKNYYREPISEELMNSKEKLHEEIKAFSSKVDSNLYAVIPKPQSAQAAPAAGTTPASTPATPATTAAKTEKAEVKDTKTQEKETKPKKVAKKPSKKPAKKAKSKPSKNGKKK